MNKKAVIELSKERREKLTHAIQLYVKKELGMELENFPAQFFLDFMLKELGASVYNQALDDVHGWLSDKFQYLADDMYLLSKD